jgi:hypothetical protein
MHKIFRLHCGLDCISHKEAWDLHAQMQSSHRCQLAENSAAQNSKVAELKLDQLAKI